MTGRTLAGRGAIATVERAMEVAGGAGFYRGAGLERAFRDVQGARYHPLQEKPQTALCGPAGARAGYRRVRDGSPRRGGGAMLRPAHT